MMKAIRAALDPSDAQAHIRVVCFMTDGYVGNDMVIIAEIQKHPNARIFSSGLAARSTGSFSTRWPSTDAVRWSTSA